jgi:predicted GIY-YIG superfamily endonuclease
VFIDCRSKQCSVLLAGILGLQQGHFLCSLMSIYWDTIYIDKDPIDPYKGWGWVEVKTVDTDRFGISTRYPETYTKLRSEWHRFPNSGNLPSRGKAGSKKFTLNIKGELITIRVQKCLTIQAICAWSKTWAGEGVKVITPGNRTHDLDSEKISHQAYFVYFIFNEDSNAIKIGIAHNVQKRMMSLQTSSPAKLKLMKSLQVNGSEEALKQERLLHQKFSAIRLNGEWFKADTVLLEFIEQL